MSQWLKIDYNVRKISPPSYISPKLTHAAVLQSHGIFATTKLLV